jgi:hypothetical protein
LESVKLKYMCCAATGIEELRDFDVRYLM